MAEAVDAPAPPLPAQLPSPPRPSLVAAPPTSPPSLPLPAVCKEDTGAASAKQPSKSCSHTQASSDEEIHTTKQDSPVAVAHIPPPLTMVSASAPPMELHVRCMQAPSPTDEAEAFLVDHCQENTRLVGKFTEEKSPSLVNNASTPSEGLALSAPLLETLAPSLLAAKGADSAEYNKRNPKPPGKSTEKAVTSGSMRSPLSETLAPSAMPPKEIASGEVVKGNPRPGRKPTEKPISSAGMLNPSSETLVPLATAARAFPADQDGGNSRPAGKPVWRKLAADVSTESTTMSSSTFMGADSWPALDSSKTIREGFEVGPEVGKSLGNGPVNTPLSKIIREGFEVGPEAGISSVNGPVPKIAREGFEVGTEAGKSPGNGPVNSLVSPNKFNPAYLPFNNAPIRPPPVLIHPMPAPEGVPPYSPEHFPVTFGDLGAKSPIHNGLPVDHFGGRNPNNNHNYPNMQRSASTREQGRGNNNHRWHGNSRSFNNNSKDLGIGIPQQRVGPRNLPRPNANFMGPNPGYFNPAGFPNPPGGMYYMPAPPPLDSVHAPYFPPVGPPQGVVVTGPDPRLLSMVQKQIEYYFSVENLCRDIYLRKNMDDCGYIPVSIISGFNRVRMLTDNPGLILNAMRNSRVVEVQGDRLRKRDDWEKWLLPQNPNGIVDSTSLPVANKVDQIDAGLDQNMHITSPTIDTSDRNSTSDLAGTELNSLTNLLTNVTINGSNESRAPDLCLKEHKMKPVEDFGGQNAQQFDRCDLKLSSNPVGKLGLEPVANSSSLITRLNGPSEKSRTLPLKKGGLSTAFATSNLSPSEDDTFQLDEELESEGSMQRDQASQLTSRYEEDEDDGEVNDCDVQKLIIVTQSKRSGKGEWKGSDGQDLGGKAITDDLASVINDGLYFYEQNFC